MLVVFWDGGGEFVVWGRWGSLSISLSLCLDNAGGIECLSSGCDEQTCCKQATVGVGVGWPPPPLPGFSFGYALVCAYWGRDPSGETPRIKRRRFAGPGSGGGESGQSEIAPPSPPAFPPPAPPSMNRTSMPMSSVLLERLNFLVGSELPCSLRRCVLRTFCSQERSASMYNDAVF